MVHQTRAIKIRPAPKASSKINHMSERALSGVLASVLILGTLVGCASRPVPMPPSSAPSSAQSAPAVRAEPTPSPPPPPRPLAAAEPGLSVAVPAEWDQLPGWKQASLDAVWPVLLRNCERATEAVRELCPDIRRLAIADEAVRREWMERRLRPYRLQTESGQAEGLLTAYYEPVFEASRTAKPGFEVPLHSPPPELAAGPQRNLPWFTREEIESRAEVRNRLKPLAWLADPVDALVLHIQGSGRLRFKSEDGTSTEVGVRYAASNNQPYRSVGRALLDAREITDASWPGIQAWFARNPSRAQAVLWTNPRYVFFNESPILDPELGPPGAQGVPLSAMHSIAVDPRSVPYGALLWLHTRSAELQLSHLVVAQDTGAAIVGAVRADLFAGTGTRAGQLAGRIKQPLWLWVFKPR